MARRRRKRAFGSVFVVGGVLALGVLAVTLPIPLPYQLFAPPPSTPVETPAPVALLASEAVEALPTATPEQEESHTRSAPLAAPAPSAVNYIVRSGDTLLDLAEQYDTTIEQLLKDNHGLDPAKMRAGQLIKVPDQLAREGLARPQYVWPADGPITTPFDEPGSLWIGGFHPGLDIGASTGDYVWAAGDGVIAATATNGMGRGYGTYVLIYHSEGWSTLYAHLSKVYRPAGYNVRQGEPIGEVGMTGFADGPHLHFEVWHNGERQDPIQFLP